MGGVLAAAGVDIAAESRLAEAAQFIELSTSAGPGRIDSGQEERPSRGRGAAGPQLSRQQVKDIPLDAANTLTEIPYLDIVNEVLTGQLTAELGKDAYRAMTGLATPFAMPFSLDDVRRRTYLQLVGVAPERLYRRFATDADPDVVAREYLGLSQETLDLVSTPAADADA